MPAKTPIDSRVWQRPYLAECTPNDFDLIPKAHLFKSSCNCFYNLRQSSSLQGMGLGFVGWGWGGGWGGSEGCAGGVGGGGSRGCTMIELCVFIWIKNRGGCGVKELPSQSWRPCAKYYIKHTQNYVFALSVLLCHQFLVATFNSFRHASYVCIANTKTMDCNNV